jgi:hypothetical protein
MTYPDVDEIQRAKLLQRQAQATTPLTETETLRITEHLKAACHAVALEKLASLLCIPSWRQHQIYSSLRSRADLKFNYRKGEWFVEALP